MSIINMIFPIVYILVGIALIWFVIELVFTVRGVRKTVNDLKGQLDPTLSDVQQIVSDVQPTIKKVDPLMDRVTLTVDSVNLEMMRVDEILDNVTQITGGVNKAVGAVDNVTSAPLDLVNSLTNRFRTKFKPKYASEESVDLGGGQAAAAPTNPIVDFADAATGAASEAFKDARVKREERREAAQTKADEMQAKTRKMDLTSDRLADQFLNNANIDTGGSPSQR